MAYGWEAWKNRTRGNPEEFGRWDRNAKARAYCRGFRAAAKDLGIVTDDISCPFSILDDTTIDAAGAYDLGRYDARQVSNAKRAAVAT